MTSTMITLAEAAGTAVAALTPAPVTPGGNANGFLSTINSLFDNGTDIVKNGINLAILALGGYTIVKAKMAMAAVIMVLLVGSLVLWWVNGGLFSTSEKINKDVGAPTRLYTPPARLVAGAVPVPPGAIEVARTGPAALPAALPFAA